MEGEREEDEKEARIRTSYATDAILLLLGDPFLQGIRGIARVEATPRTVLDSHPEVTCTD